MPDYESCPCSGGTLDKLVRPAILAVLAKEPLHGYLVIKRISTLRVSRGEKPDATGVYRALRSMQRSGFITSRWDVLGSAHAKRLYHLTSSGRKCVALWVKSLRNHRAAVDELLTIAQKSCRVRHGSRCSK
jgi:PadR family transcriptional regulator, regulatory protein PadR